MSVAISLFATGIERMAWMFSGERLLAVVPQQIYSTIADISCTRRYIEVKRDADGVLRYRCGDYWLLSNEGRSAALTKVWPQVAAAIDGKPDDRQHIPLASPVGK